MLALLLLVLVVALWLPSHPLGEGEGGVDEVAAPDLADTVAEEASPGAGAADRDDRAENPVPPDEVAAEELSGEIRAEEAEAEPSRETAAVATPSRRVARGSAPQPAAPATTTPTPPGRDRSQGRVTEVAEAWLIIEAEPRAEIEIDGQVLGRTPVSILGLPPGPHRVVGRFSDGTSVRRDLEITPGMSRILLVPEAGQPPGADVGGEPGAAAPL